MIHVMPFALFRARITDVRAGSAYIGGERAAAAHEGGGCATDLGTVNVELDATGK
jgi:hypothetical protein